MADWETTWVVQKDSTGAWTDWAQYNDYKYARNLCLQMQERQAHSTGPTCNWRLIERQEIVVEVKP